MSLNCLLFIGIINFLFIQYSTQYQIMLTESSDLCSNVKKRKLKLSSNGDRSGLIVRQYNYNYHPIDWQINFFCRFQIQLSSSSLLSSLNNNNNGGGGIIAVIQYLNFRYNQTIDNCLDFIQFFRKDGTSSRKFCGHIDALIDMEKQINNNNNNDDLMLTNNSFIDRKGEMDVHIFIDKQAFDKQKMDLAIVFTAYKNCPSRWKDRDLDDVKPCSEARKYCIYSGFFNDTIMNCPYWHCVDENGCSGGGQQQQQSNERSANSQQIFYGALSSVFISFFIFVICILIFRAKEILCFNQNCYQSTSHSIRETVENQQYNPERTIEMDDQITLNRNITIAPTSSEDDKDLPPAYETLFPDRTKFRLLSFNYNNE